MAKFVKVTIGGYKVDGPDEWQGDNFDQQRAEMAKKGFIFYSNTGSNNVEEYVQKLQQEGKNAKVLDTAYEINGGKLMQGWKAIYFHDPEKAKQFLRSIPSSRISFK
jgi:hypothetical protein